MVEVVIAAAIGLVTGSYLNRLIIREPGYRYRDLKDIPDDAPATAIDDLEDVGELPPTPWLSLVRPRSWHRRWYPVVELVTAAGWAAIVHRWGVVLELVPLLFLTTVLVCLAAIDFRVLRIPDRINFPSMAIGFGSIAAVSLFRSDPGLIAGAAIGGVLYAGMLFLAHFAYPRGMGWGDVKLAWLMGFYLGWVAWDPNGVLHPALGVLRFVLYGFGLGSILGALIGAPYAFAKRSTNTAFPFGPSLAVGCFVVVLFAESIR